MPLIRKPADDATPPTAGLDFEQARSRLKDAAPDARRAAARALAAFPQAAALLGAAAGTETDERVRETLFTSLARIGTADSVQALVIHVRSDDASYRAGAMDALKAMPHLLSGAVDHLLADADSDVRVLACDLVRALPAEQATALLSSVLDREPEVNVCAEAIDVLADVGAPAALPALRRCAVRFAGQPFLDFAIRVACDRIGAQAGARG
jgi:HEAT repeat protein